MTYTQALAIGICGQVLYHITQKLVAPSAHPVLSLTVFYAGAFVLCLPLFWLFPLQQNLSEAVSQLNWAVLAVAGSIVLIELGFLLVYRVGGELSKTFVLAAAGTAIATALVGVFWFREQFSLSKLLGLVLCMAGVALLAKKS